MDHCLDELVLLQLSNINVMDHFAKVLYLKQSRSEPTRNASLHSRPSEKMHESSSRCFLPGLFRSLRLFSPRRLASHYCCHRCGCPLASPMPTGRVKGSIRRKATTYWTFGIGNMGFQLAKPALGGNCFFYSHITQVGGENVQTSAGNLRYMRLRVSYAHRFFVSFSFCFSA